MTLTILSIVNVFLVAIVISSSLISNLSLIDALAVHLIIEFAVFLRVNVAIRSERFPAFEYFVDVWFISVHSINPVFNVSITDLANHYIQVFEYLLSRPYNFYQRKLERKRSIVKHSYLTFQILL